MAKDMHPDRRDFIKKATLLTGAISVGGHSTLARTVQQGKAKNPLPAWKGFNLLDFFSANPKNSYGETTAEDLKWMQDWGFDVNEKALEKVDRLVYRAQKYGMHVSLNLHRAPGYCINAGFHEPYNLWEDEEAQDAFYWHWSMWAGRYKHMTRDKISFDLLNEPAMITDMNDQDWYGHQLDLKLLDLIRKA